jgi:hypothetical protein
MGSARSVRHEHVAAIRHPPAFARPEVVIAMGAFACAPFRPSALPTVGDASTWLSSISFGTRRRAPELAIKWGKMSWSLRMDPIEEFHRHANECRRMARVVRDPQSRDSWNSMAERWLRCAAEFETAKGAAKKSSSRHRRTGGWPRGLKPQRERGEEPPALMP